MQMESTWLWVIMLPVGLILLAALILLLVIFALIPSRKPFPLKKKHAVVTGGTRGIGKQLALCLIEKGCNVSIIARNEEDLEQTCEELQSAADRSRDVQKVRFYSLDLTKSFKEVESVMRLIEAELGPVDVLINNVGGSVQALFDEEPVTDYESEVKVNYLSAVYLTRCVVAHMKRRFSGHISFVSSEAGQFAIYGYCAFAPTKFALRGLADALQMELMPYNIHISVLYPPNTDSESFRKHSLERTEEMRLISDTGGVFTPKQVAEAHIRDIENGQYSTSVGLNGWILNLATAGAAPERSVLRAFLQVVFGGLLRLLMLAYLWKFNRIVRKGYERRRAQREAQQNV